MIEGIMSAFELVTLLMSTRLMEPTTVSGLGPRSRAPSRRNNGAVFTLRIAIPVKVLSSTIAQPTLSSATPRQLSTTQFEIVTF